MRALFLALLALTAFSVGAVVLYASDSSNVSHTATQSISAFGVCKKITNASPTGKQVYVPTQTSAEWVSFYTHPPSGVAVDQCVTECPNGGTVVAPQVCRYAISGSYNFTVPVGITQLKITVVGGGGGFGSIDHSHWNGYGGGGGGGAIKTVSVTPGQVIPFSVGRGGNSISHWINGGIGGTGGASTVSVFGMTGGGGRGGAQCGYRNGARGRKVYNLNCPAYGGSGSGGTQNCTGGNGRNANYGRISGLPGACNGGAGAATGGGSGGATPIGGDGGARRCGSGGSGMSNHGGDGCVEIDWN